MKHGIAPRMQVVNELTCFKMGDTHRDIGVNLGESISHFIGRAVAHKLRAKSTVIGFDRRGASHALAAAN